MKKKRLLIYGAILFACALALVLSVGKVTSDITTLLKKDTMQQLTEVTKQTTALVQQQINGDLDELRRLSATISALGNPQDNSIRDFLTQEEWLAQDVRLAISQTSGETYTNDGLSFNIREQAVFQRALAGESIISTVHDIQLDQAIDHAVVLMVPIHKGTTVVGTLAATRNVSRYEELVRFSLYNGYGTGYIMTPNGQVVIHDQSNNPAPDFVPADGFGSGNALPPELAQMESDFASQKSGNLQYSANGESAYLSYAPLGINDWYLVNRIAVQAVEGQKILLRQGAIAVTIISAIIFGLLLIVLFISYERRYKVAEQLALFDPLTGLPNWQRLQQHYGKLHRRQGLIYILIRIPDFKQASTVFGYNVAARLLKSIGATLSPVLEKGEMAVHISEDCFALLLNPLNERALAKRLDPLLAKLRALTITDGNITYNYHCSFVAGAYRIANEKEPFVAVNRRANSVVESQLHHSGVAWALFDQRTEEKITLQDALLPDLLNALKHDEFVPFFQPQYDAHSKEIVGAEVLARWQHPKHGTIMPGVFVPLLETRGCVLELDLIMFEQACKMIHGWLESGLLPVSLSVNISRLNLHRQDFFDRLIGLAHRYEIPTSLITLEMSELAATENSEKVGEIAKRLKEEGFILAIDEFNAAGSLNLLHQVPLDLLKFARNFLLTFTPGERSNALFRHVIELAHELNISVVAEGVETIEQEEMVVQNGCNMVQGFLYSKPLARMDFEELMFAEIPEE